MKDLALGVAVRVENLLISSQGPSQIARQQRLVLVVSDLLDFWPEEQVVQWLLKENRGLRRKRPIDLINSEYATEDLLSAIREMKRRYKRSGKSRLRRLLREPSILEPAAHELAHEAATADGVDSARISKLFRDTFPPELL
jgi:hypothetical protein